MAVEATHLVDSKDPYAAEGAGGHGQHLALCHICPKDAVGRGLKPEKGDVAGDYIPLKSTLGDLLGQAAGHYHLILHSGAAYLAGAGVAAVEAHEGVAELIRELALYLRLVHILWHSVVYVQKGHNIITDAGADELREGAVDVHLAGHRKAPARKA